MPIEHAVKTKFISEDEFHDIDYEVMGLAFSIHSELGRLWNEKIYQNELAFRCQKSGFEKVKTEVPILVSHQDFRKCFYVDLVLDDTVIYELKVVKALAGEHHQQTLNYLFLLGMQHGKLINMHPASVDSRFVSTSLTRQSRFNYKIEDQGWQALDKDSVWFKQTMMSLLDDWGAFLDTTLFYDAIKHFRGGEENVVKKIRVMNGRNALGMQKVHFLKDT